MAHCNCDYTPPESRPCMNCRGRAAVEQKLQAARALVAEANASQSLAGLEQYHQRLLALLPPLIDETALLLDTVRRLGKACDGWEERSNEAAYRKAPARPTPAEIRERIHESLAAVATNYFAKFALESHHIQDYLNEAANNAAQQIVFLLDEKESPNA